MKNQFKVFAICILVSTSVLFTAFGPQQKDKNKDKEQKEKQDKIKKDKSDKDDSKQQEDKKDKTNNGQNDDKDKKDKKDKSHDDKGNQGKEGEDFNWNRETFKDRDKIKNKDKVTICHKFNNNNDPAVTIKVSSHALKAHLGHGDVMGECPVEKNNNFSDDYIRKRTDYYNDLQNTHDRSEEHTSELQ